MSTTRAQRAEAARWRWQRALDEGRVIAYTANDGSVSHVAYPSREQAERTLTVQLARIAAGVSMHVGAALLPAAVAK